MNTQATSVQEQHAGCSLVVVAMLTILSCIVGIIAGMGGFYAYLQSSPQGVKNLGLVASTPKMEPRKCPDCDAVKNSASSHSTYAFVYPIEETLRIEGKLDKNVLRGFFIKERSKFQQCYQKQLDLDPTTKGEVSLQFTVSSKGNVNVAVVRQDTTNNAMLKDCVLNTLKKWNFANKVKSDLAVVKIDILFVPLGSNGP